MEQTVPCRGLEQGRQHRVDSQIPGQRVRHSKKASGDPSGCGACPSAEDLRVLTLLLLLFWPSEAGKAEDVLPEVLKGCGP